MQENERREASESTSEEIEQREAEVEEEEEVDPVDVRKEPLTEEQEANVDAQQRGNAADVLLEKFNIPVTRKDLRTLQPGTWLNDEVGLSVGRAPVLGRAASTSRARP